MEETLSLLGRRWIAKRGEDDRSQQGSLLTQLLASRGMSEPKQIEDYCDAGLHKLHDPYHLPGMRQAAQILAQAIERGEFIGIFGDYDADGQTASALMSRIIEDLGGRVRVHIPHRIDEGYGLNIEALAHLKADGVTLVVTVDCGISNVDEVAWAKENGLQVIVTDHHLPPEQLPPAAAVVNPHVTDPSLSTPYPSPELAGCGVAFKLAEAVCDLLRDDRSLAHRYVDLVALGTIADVVSLTGENRSIVKAGLERINGRQSVPGIQALVDLAAISGRVKAGHVAFTLAPQLNAAGRISDPSIGVRLLLADRMEQALPLAQTLHEENKKRRQIEEQVTSEARVKADAYDLTEQMTLVIDGEGWHPGVVGIVASRLVDAFYRPTIVLSVDGDMAKGSGRSIPGFDLHAALSHCEDLFEAFGGHAAAAGLTIPVKNLPAFRHRFEEIARSMLSQDDLIPQVHFDAEVSIERLSLEEVSALGVMEPFGIGNPSPIVVCHNVRVRPEGFGKERQHLRLRVLSEDHVQPAHDRSHPQAIGFGLYDRLAPDLINVPMVDLAVTPEVNEWNGTRRVQLIIKDVRPASGPGLMAFLNRRVAKEIAAARDQLADLIVRDGRGQSKEAVIKSLLDERRSVCILSGSRGSGSETINRLMAIDPMIQGRSVVWTASAMSEPSGSKATAPGSPISRESEAVPRVYVVEEEVSLSQLEQYARLHLSQEAQGIPMTLVIWAPPLHATALVTHLAWLRSVCHDVEVQLLYDQSDVDRLPELAERIYPNAELLRRLYGLIKQESPVSMTDDHLSRLAAQASRLWGPVVGVETMVTALDIFQQLDLLVGDGAGLTMRENPPKVDLTHAFRYNEGVAIKQKLGDYLELLRAARPSEFLQRLLFSLFET